MGIIKKLKNDIKKTKEVKSKPKMHEMLITVVARGYGDKVLKVLNQNKITHNVVKYGRGTTDSYIANLIGLNNTEKEIILSIVPESNVKKTLNNLNKQILSKHKFLGIAFTIPLKSITNTSIDILNS